MAGINRGRVWLGTLVGGLVWVGWDFAVNRAILGPHCKAAQEAGQFLAEPRYGAFLPIWIVTIFALSYIIALLYASVRGTCGAGPKTALGVGILVGFAAAFPENFSMATWAPFDRIFPLWWMIDSWLGAIAAALIAGALYREPRPQA